jgi:hypothetical protein
MLVDELLFAISQPGNEKHKVITHDSAREIAARLATKA